MGGTQSIFVRQVQILPTGTIFRGKTLVPLNRIHGFPADQMIRMVEQKPVYKTDHGVVVIELVLRDVMQLFNSLDPSPFHEKDLDKDAEQYIYDVVDDIPMKDPVKMVIYLPEQSITEQTKESIILGIHNHFSYRSGVADRDLKKLFLRGRIVLLVAAVCLLICLLGRQELATLPQDITVRMAAEALLVFGWVTMWEPVYIFIYGWWPIIHRRRIHDKIRTMDVEVLPVPVK
jgi:hypothetical protein